MGVRQAINDSKATGTTSVFVSYVGEQGGGNGNGGKYGQPRGADAMIMEKSTKGGRNLACAGLPAHGRLLRTFVFSPLP